MSYIPNLSIILQSSHTLSSNFICPFHNTINSFARQNLLFPRYICITLLCPVDISGLSNPFQSVMSSTNCSLMSRCYTRRQKNPFSGPEHNHHHFSIHLNIFSLLSCNYLQLHFFHRSFWIYLSFFHCYPHPCIL